MATALLLSACGGDSSSSSDQAGAGSTTAQGSSPVVPAPQPAQADATPASFADLTGDAARGQRSFAQCRSCHAIEPGRNLVGPSLHGIVGREAGTVPAYAYSPANKNSHLVWTPEELFTYLEGPTRKIPGTKMAYAVRDPQIRADLIAYLATIK